MIDAQMEGALILVAVLTCLIAPIVFKKIYGKFEDEQHKTVVSFIGSNRMTLPVVRELDINSYETHLYHTKVDKIDDKISRSCFDIKELDGYNVDAMKAYGVFEVDLLVASTGDEEKNAEIARFAKRRRSGARYCPCRISRIDRRAKRA